MVGRGRIELPTRRFSVSHPPVHHRSRTTPSVTTSKENKPFSPPAPDSFSPIVTVLTDRNSKVGSKVNAVVGGSFNLCDEPDFWAFATSDTKILNLQSAKKSRHSLANFGDFAGTLRLIAEA